MYKLLHNYCSEEGIFVRVSPEIRSKLRRVIIEVSDNDIDFHQPLENNRAINIILFNYAGLNYRVEKRRNLL